MRLVTNRKRSDAADTGQDQLKTKLAPQDELLLALLSIALGASAQGLDRLQGNLFCYLG